MHKPFKMGKESKRIEKHCRQLKIPIKKHPKKVFAFIFTGEMEKLYTQITETQRINQKGKLRGIVTADLRINTFKNHEHFATFVSYFVYLLSG